MQTQNISGGFMPLQQLQKIAQEKMRQKKQEYFQKHNIPQSVNNPNKLVVQPKIHNKYQVNKDTIFYIKFGIYFKKQEQDRIIVVDYDKANKQIQNHWLKFRMWSYEECNRLKESCCQQDQYRNYVYNKSKLFRTKIKYLLLDWSFKQNNPDMKLMHVNNILSDESINDFMNLHPNILFYIESELNSILQANG